MIFYIFDLFLFSVVFLVILRLFKLIPVIFVLLGLALLGMTLLINYIIQSTISTLSKVKFGK